ncbi:DNA-formamidopyrimidine glycosylase family protein [Allokutzneria oryzae]|uniref:DNA-(apurinic or apyrimidinic site) lyase n=1 Tax=Allokutzneria oryzae TaxID=1378989 RepID=A0ABV6A8L7_9PSEU
MPEGDTVFLAGKRLDEALAGQRLSRGELRHPRLSTVDLKDRVVLGVHSVGKHLFLRFDDSRSLHTHFRMDGAWHLYAPGERWRGPGHQVRAVLATPTRVAVGFRLHDMELLATADEQRLVGHLGPDLLDPSWTEEHEAEAIRRLTADPNRELGLALLDQRVMAGVGNLYKSEVCFILGVSPWAPVSSADAGRVVNLARKLLLRNAFRPEQSTTGELARGRQHWVYERGGRACRRCGTPIRRAPQGTGVEQRGTYHCPTCQVAPERG